MLEVTFPEARIRSLSKDPNRHVSNHADCPKYAVLVNHEYYDIVNTEGVIPVLGEDCYTSETDQLIIFCDSHNVELWGINDWKWVWE